MSLEAEALFLCSGAVAVLAYALKKRRMQKKKERKKRVWCKERKRESGIPITVPLPGTEAPNNQYTYFPGMSVSVFEELLKEIGPKISKQATLMRNPIPVGHRMAVSLKFLSTGEIYRTLEQHFGISTQSIGVIVVAFCKALTETLSDNVKLPSNASDWMKICEGFERLRGLPNCVGTVQLNCINLNAAVHGYATSTKKRYQTRLVLLTIADANSNIIYAEVIHEEDRSESNNILATKLSAIMSTLVSKLPEPTELPGSNVQMPFFFASKNAFIACDNVLTPYPISDIVDDKQEYFNTLMERCHKASDIMLGKMCSAFKFLQLPLRMGPFKAEILVKGAIHLHNHLNVHSQHLYMPEECIAEWTTASREKRSMTVLENISVAPTLYAARTRDECTTGSREKRSMTVLENISVAPTLYAARTRDELSDYCYKNDATFSEDVQTEMDSD